jgi:hypothetical protein
LRDNRIHCRLAEVSHLSEKNEDFTSGIALSHSNRKKKIGRACSLALTLLRENSLLTGKNTGKLFIFRSRFRASSNTQYQLERSPRSKPIVSFCSEIFLFRFTAAVLIFFIAGLLYLLCFEHVDNLGAYSIPSETGLLIPSGFINYR